MLKRSKFFSKILRLLLKNFYCLIKFCSKFLYKRFYMCTKLKRKKKESLTHQILLFVLVNFQLSVKIFEFLDVIKRELSIENSPRFVQSSYVIEDFSVRVHLIGWRGVGLGRWLGCVAGIKFNLFNYFFALALQRVESFFQALLTLLYFPQGFVQTLENGKNTRPQIVGWLGFCCSNRFFQSQVEIVAGLVVIVHRRYGFEGIEIIIRKIKRIQRGQNPGVRYRFGRE